MFLRALFAIEGFSFPVIRAHLSSRALLVIVSSSYCRELFLTMMSILVLSGNPLPQRRSDGTLLSISLFQYSASHLVPDMLATLSKEQPQSVTRRYFVIPISFATFGVHRRTSSGEKVIVCPWTLVISSSAIVVFPSASRPMSRPRKSVVAFLRSARMFCQAMP